MDGNPCYGNPVSWYPLLYFLATQPALRRTSSGDGALISMQTCDHHRRRVDQDARVDTEPEHRAREGTASICYGRAVVHSSNVPATGQVNVDTVGYAQALVRIEPL